MTFREAIMLRCVKWCSEMRDAIFGKKVSKGDVFSAILQVFGLDVSVKVFFNNGFESNKDCFDILFLL